MICAAESGCAEVARHVLRVRDDSHADADRDGRTALMWAAAVGNLPVLEELLKAGANPDAADAQGKTARDYAQELGKGKCAAALDMQTRPSESGQPVSMRQLFVAGGGHR